MLNILIPAVGGQGGGVLMDWVARALRGGGLTVQALSLPGLSQRAGSTIYYIEADASGRRPVFSPFPVAGEIDVILCPEYLEFGRALFDGYARRDRTLAVASTHRYMATREKMGAGDGIYPSEAIDRAARSLCRRVLQFDARDLVRRHDMEDVAVNAVLFGCLAATEALSVPAARCEQAIREAGIAVRPNLEAFSLGYEVGAEGVPPPPPGRDDDWEAFKRGRARLLERDGRAFLALAADVERLYPESLQRLLAEALCRLIAYQGPKYARRYLEFVREAHRLETGHPERAGGHGLTEAYARHLANWMTYEDAVRVAELKTDPERFRRIRREFGIRDDQAFVVRDYLKPDAFELLGILPAVLAAPLLRRFEARTEAHSGARPAVPALAVAPATSTLPGYLSLRWLAWLKPLRPHSWRYGQEHAQMAIWRREVLEMARASYRLGCVVVRSGRLVKGYGRVRRRTTGDVIRLLQAVVRPLMDLPGARDDDYQAARDVTEQALRLFASEAPRALERVIDLAHGRGAAAGAQRAAVAKNVTSGNWKRRRDA